MKKTGLKPAARFGIDRPIEGESYRRVFPFRRSWLAIGVLVVVDIIFTFPAAITFKQAITEWSQFESLFDLVAAVFLSAWLLGWIIAPLILTGVLVMMVFGREVLTAGPGTVGIFFGVPLLGIKAQYDVAGMRNLRFDRPPKNFSTSWRGPHMLFDYGPNTVAVGSAFHGDGMAELRSRLEMATGATIRRGEALPEEILTPPQALENDPVKSPLTESAVNLAPLSLTSPSSLVLIIANLIPVAGHLMLDWSLVDVMVLYWAESAVIGFFNICKMAVIGRWRTLIYGLFFTGHFGGFMAIHFLFIYTIFIQQPHTGNTPANELADVAHLFIELWPALAALFISHAFSFFANFIGRAEYRGKSLDKQMSEPYRRIIFMHMVIIFGGGLTMVLGNPVPILLIVIALKIYFDVKAHLKERGGT